MDRCARAVAMVGAVILLAACARTTGPSANPSTGAGRAAPSSAPLKRIVAGVISDPFTLNSMINTAGGNTMPGVPELEQMLNAGLAQTSDSGMAPLLAEQVPTIENGAWRVAPDGSMETTWRIRGDARWHDGTALTANDLQFTVQVLKDPDFPAFRNRIYDLITRIETPDDRTAVVYWSQIDISADRLFSFTNDNLALPMPEHILAPAFAADKATFIDLPYWSEQFVGTGPFRLRTWVADSHLIMEANDQFILGRPKIDQVEVRFIPDPNAMVASILAGVVEITLGRGFTPEQAGEVADQWRDGHMITAPARWVVIFPQLLTPSPAIVGDVQFRRALLHALDRQHLMEVYERGATAVADSLLEPNQPQYADIEKRVARYPYDPRRALQILDGLGFRQGSDGALRDAAGQPLAFEARTPDVGPNQQMNLAVVADWKAVGLSPDIVVVPRQRLGDNEYRWTFPSFELTKRAHDVKSLANFHSSQTPLPENHFLGSNVSRYMSPEFDRMLDRYFSTISVSERTKALGDIVATFSENVLALGLFYDHEPALVANRIQNVVGAHRLDTTETWNADKWDVD